MEINNIVIRHNPIVSHVLMRKVGNFVLREGIMLKKQTIVAIFIILNLSLLPLALAGTLPDTGQPSAMMMLKRSPVHHQENHSMGRMLSTILILSHTRNLMRMEMTCLIQQQNG